MPHMLDRFQISWSQGELVQQKNFLRIFIHIESKVANQQMENDFKVCVIHQVIIEEKEWTTSDRSMQHVNKVYANRWFDINFLCNDFNKINFYMCSLFVCLQWEKINKLESAK